MPQISENKLHCLTSLLCDLESELHAASFTIGRIARIMEEAEGDRKQRNISEEMRKDAIDELLKREGLYW